MRKSILRFGALALMSMMSIGSWAQGGAMIGHSSYNLNSDGTATLLHADNRDTWSGTWGVFKVGEGEEEKAYRVTKVDDNAFADVTDGTPVTIPTTLVEIGKNAFKGMQIAVIGDEQPIFNFKSNVTLGEGAFENATFPTNTIINLGERLSLPKNIFKAKDDGSGNNIQTVTCTGLTEIPDYAFFNCKQLMFFGYLQESRYYLPTGLHTVGKYAFANCVGLLYFQFKAEDINKATDRSRISEVEPYAFQNCAWLNNIKFNNVFEKFEGLTYAEGSFYGCGLTSIDLTGSNINVTEKISNTEQYTGKGVPAYAFYGNNIEITNNTELVLPSDFVVIGKGAFQDNNTLTIPTLPSSLEYLGEDAFSNTADAAITQPSLYLPNDFVKIGKNAFNNRSIATVYAYPTFNTDNKSVPTLDNSNASSISATVVPVVAPWTLAGGSSTNVKAQYTSKGWPAVNYAKLITTATPTEVTYDNVVYTIGTQGEDGVYAGVYAVTPKTYNTSSITIPGMFDNSKVSIKSEGGDNCQYTLVFKVNNPTGNVTEKSGVNVTSLTFNPDTREGDVANTFSGASYTEIPICAVANCSAKLEEVTFGEGVKEVAADAFKSFEKLTKVNLGSVTKVGDDAFNGTGITEITLPASLQTFGTSAFGGAKLKTVNVQYQKTGTGKTIPAPAIGVFGANAKHLNILDGATATREDYMARSSGGTESPTYYWSQFFETITKVSVKTTATGATLAAVASVDDVDDEGNVTRVFELSDKNDIAQIQITNAPATGAPAVRYTRNFNNAHYQAWFVPFNYTYRGTEGCKFYYIYDTTQSDDYTADATTSIELKEVKVGKTIKASTPYIVKADNDGPITFESDAIVNTVTVNDVTFGNVQNQFTFKGIYLKKEKTTGEGNDWYALKDGALYNYNGTEHGLNAYRFYMEYNAQNTIPYEFVKFVVLDDEDATSIENVKANSLNAPMFDLMGRQITAPAKGQVYIQNGVKKLAK